MDTSPPDELLLRTLEAVQTFYQSTDAGERTRAHKWLVQLQDAAEGWRVGWQLIATGSSIEVQYFGVTLLHHKLSKAWPDVVCAVRLDYPNEDDEDEAIARLGARFIETLLVLARSARMVVSKLCLCYASYLVNAATTKSKLTTLLGELEAAASSRGIDGGPIVFELLTLLPVELSSMPVSKGKRLLVRDFLTSFSPSFLRLLCERLSPGATTSPQQRVELLKCLHAWIEARLLTLCDVDELVPSLFDALHDDELMDGAADVLVEVITSATSHDYPTAVLVFFQRLACLEPLANRAIEAGDRDRVDAFCTLCTGALEAHCRLFVRSDDPDFQTVMLTLVRIILNFTSIKGHYPEDETCSEQTLALWYCLQDEMLSLPPISTDTTSAGDVRYRECLFEAYVALLRVLCVKVQYPPDQVFSRLSEDDREKLRCYRIDIQDTIMYVYALLRDRCLAYLADRLAYLTSDPSSPWQQVEAVLFLLQGACESIEADEHTHLPRVISLLPTLPPHERVSEASIMMLGALSEWLHSNTELIAQVLPLLLRGLLTPSVVRPCSIALKDLCHECAQLFTEPTISEVVRVCCAAANPLTNPQISDADKISVRLVEIGALTISALPWEKILVELERLVAPLIGQLTEGFERNANDQGARNCVERTLNCVMGALRSLDPFEEANGRKHPIVVVYEKLLSILTANWSWLAFEEIAIAAMECISKVLEVSHERLPCELISPTVSLLSAVFNSTMFSCVLDTCSLMIAIHASVDECRPIMCGLFDTLFTTCINADIVSMPPDLQQSFMSLLARVTKLESELLLSCGTRQLRAVECACALLRRPETATISGACHFLATYSNAIERRAEVKQAFAENCGQHVVSLVVACIAGVAPRQTSDNFSDLLFTLRSSFLSLISAWLAAALEQSLPGSANTSAAQRDHFRQAVLLASVNKRRLRATVKDFALQCRGLYGTAYAAGS